MPSKDASILDVAIPVELRAMLSQAPTGDDVQAEFGEAAAASALGDGVNGLRQGGTRRLPPTQRSLASALADCSAGLANHVVLKIGEKPSYQATALLVLELSAYSPHPAASLHRVGRFSQ